MSKEKVIIILCDTLRAKSLPHYGNSRNTLPNLARVIDNDFIVYNRAYAPAPWTTPSHLSLFTGLYPSQVMETKTSFNLDPIFKTLAELFQDSGYRTFACIANALIAKQFGFGKGFDTFLQLWLPDPGGDEISLKVEGKDRLEKIMRLLQSIAAGDNRMDVIKGMRERIHKRYRDILIDATLSTNKAMKSTKRFLSENSSQQVFCFINLMQAHNRYNPPRVTRNTFVKRNTAHERYYNERIPLDHYATGPFSSELIEYIKLKYEEEILYLDLVIADFIDFLKRSSLYDDCTLIITSDHGEHFGEKGHVQHHFSVYEPLTRIPLYIKWSGKAENHDKHINSLVMLQDLYTTFLNKLNHWQPCPESSFDLNSSDKRQWVISQLPDVTHDIQSCKERSPSFSMSDIGLEDTTLTAYVFNNGEKIIENGNKTLCYNLNIDPEEDKPYSTSAESLKVIKEIKSSL
ncbi:MAG: sulfatase [Thermodesulfovibrionia bacterium]|nr:sulfatase [Thermodesulfovibrionia bacterium]